MVVESDKLTEALIYIRIRIVDSIFKKLVRVHHVADLEAPNTGAVQGTATS